MLLLRKTSIQKLSMLSKMRFCFEVSSECALTRFRIQRARANDLKVGSKVFRAERGLLWSSFRGNRCDPKAAVAKLQDSYGHGFRSFFENIHRPEVALQTSK